MTITLSAANKRDVSESLSGTTPEAVADAAVLWSITWALAPEIDPDDTTDEGADAAIAAQRVVSDLAEAIWAGVSDGSITASASPRAEVDGDFTSVYDDLLTAAERVEFGVEKPEQVEAEEGTDG